MAYQVENLVATAISTSEIELSWDDTDLDGETFDIERDGSIIEYIYAGDHTAISPYTDSGLDPDTEYTYRVRAVGGTEPWAPTDLAGLAAWYDFSDAATMFTDTARTTAVSSDGQEVRGLSDLSANARHIQAAGAAGTYPLYKIAIQNGLSVLRFATDFMNTVSPHTNPTSYTIFWVASRTSTTGVQSVYDADGAQRVFQTRYAAGVNTAEIIPQPATGSTTSVTGLSTPPGPDVLSFRVVASTASGARAYRNGTPGTATNAPAGNANAQAIHLGAQGDTSPGTQSLTGDIMEIIHYDSALSAADHNLVGDYLQTKWATPAWTTVT